MYPSAPRLCSEPGGQRPVLSLSLDLIVKCGMKLLIHSKTSTTALLKLESGISNFTSHLIGSMITYPCWDSSSTMLVKGALLIMPTCRPCSDLIHWNENVTFTQCSLLTAPEVVSLTTSDATNNEHFVIWPLFRFTVTNHIWSNPFHHVWTV